MTGSHSAVGTLYSDNQPDTQSPIRACVASLALNHFRNYRGVHLKAGGRSVVMIGPNGAGKTNMLEAISLLTPGRGLRRASIADMDNAQEQSCWSVVADIDGAQGAARIGTGRDPEADGETARRVVRIDGKNKSQTELGKYFSALWLTPQMDNLFIEGGTTRRKFLDRLVFSFDDEHATRVNAYETAMRERNRLLAQGRADPLWLSALEQKMAEQGVAIAVARMQAMEGLMVSMLESSHPFPKASIAVTGKIEALLAEHSALLAEEAFRALLAQSRQQDAYAGRTLVGVHRSQVVVTHLEKQMDAERCSTGEQKALLVSVILAQANAGVKWHGRVPVLLLDEVSTHLDSERRKGLYEALTATGAQCWLTGTDSDTFDGFDARRVAVANGQISVE